MSEEVSGGPRPVQITPEGRDRVKNALERVGYLIQQREPETWEDALDRVLAEMRALMIRKHHDYGPGNIGALGVPGVFVRIWDKVNRLKSLIWESKTAAVIDESIEDTLIDLANYAGPIAIMLARGYWGLPSSADEEPDGGSE